MGRPHRSGVGCCGFREHKHALPRLRVRPFAAHDPAATTASADSCRVTGRLSAAGAGRLASRPTPRQASPDKGSNLPRAPAASTLRSLDDPDFDVFGRLVRTAPPSMRFVFLGSRFRLHLPSHPASRRRSWLRLVVSGDLHPRAAAHAGRTKKWSPPKSEATTFRIRETHLTVSTQDPRYNDLVY